MLFVHLGTPEDGEQFFGSRWPEARAVSDEREVLYEACEHRVRGAAHRILPPRLDPEAAAQQAWVQAIHRARKLDPHRDPVPWMVSICVNLCISLVRRDKAGRVALDRRRRRDVVASAGSEGHGFASSRVREGVATLSRAQQQIVYLRYACDMPYPEIAEVLGLREDTVRKRLSRAYRQLRMMWGGDWPSQDGA